MKVEVVVVDPVFHVELTPDEAWILKVLFGAMSENHIASVLSDCRHVVDHKDVLKTAKDFYNALPAENSNVPHVSKDVLFQSVPSVK